jgi:hypothetical protein
MSSDAIPGVFSLSLTEQELSILSAIPSEKTTSNAAALYILSCFSVSGSVIPPRPLTVQREETERLKTIATEPFGILRLNAQKACVQTFIDEWTRRWCSPSRSDYQNWYLTFVARSSQLVLNCRILRQIRDDQESFEMMKQDIVNLSLRILTDAHDQPQYLATLNHTMSLPFATLLVLRLASNAPPIVTKCAVRFAGDRQRPGAELPTFMNFNAEQVMAMIW